MQDNDYKKSADVAIRNLQKLLEFHRTSLKHWKDSEYCDTEIGREMIETFQDSIKEVQSEIQAYEQYKATGVFISRQARVMLQKAKESKCDNERDL